MQDNSFDGAAPFNRVYSKRLRTDKLGINVEHVEDKNCCPMPNCVYVGPQEYTANWQIKKSLREKNCMKNRGTSWQAVLPASSESLRNKHSTCTGITQLDEKNPSM